MMKIQMQPKKHEAAKHVLTTMLCMLAVLMVAFAPVTSALAIIQVETPEIVNTFVLGDLNYEITYVANPPEAATAEVANMPDPFTQTGTAAAAVYTFTTGEPTLIGYQFLGWAKKADAAENEVDYPLNAQTKQCSVPVEYDEDGMYNPATATTTKTVYAVWKQMDFVLSFDTQTDEAENPDDQTITYQMPYGTHGELPEPERVGYNFIGWTLTPGETAEDYISDQTIVEIAGNHTVYAQWGAKSYVVRFLPNGGVGEAHTQIIEYDKPTALTKNIFTKDDYTFGGWALSPDEGAAVEYPDEQTVVNLLEEGVLDLYAVWIQNPHTVYFDYNGGTGSMASMPVLNGQAYGHLPEYPVHPTETVSENEIMSYLFTGWYTAPTGGTRVYPSDIFELTTDQTLYAQWKEAPSNNVIQNLVVKNNPDDNKDGVVDSFYVNLECTSSFEKLNIPLENLIVGQNYKLSFKESNNATYGTTSGYYNAIYGFIITTQKTLTGGSIKDESIADGGLIKDYYTNVEQWGTEEGDGTLNGPRVWETTFKAEAETMYWTWDYGLIKDWIKRDYNYTNIKLELVPPTIEFDKKANGLILHGTSKAQVLNDTSSAYATNFVFDGDGYAETMFYPITGLTPGSTYTIKLDHTFTGRLIDSNTYEYGFGIMDTIPTKYNSLLSQLGTYLSDTFVLEDVNIGKTESVTLTFTPTGTTAYWVWNLANVSDTYNCQIDIKVTEFSAKHSGGDITYYTASSSAGAQATMLNSDDLRTIALAYDLSGVTVTSANKIVENEPAVLTLTGSDIPDVLNLEVTGTQTTEPTMSTFALRSVEPTVEPAADEVQTVTTTLYMTGLNEELVNASAAAEGAMAQAWLTANEDGSQTLILPAELMTEGATITITGASYNSYNLSEITYEHLN